MGNLVKTLANNKPYCSEPSSALEALRQDSTPFYYGILQSTAKEFTRRQGETLAGIRQSQRERYTRARYVGYDGIRTMIEMGIVYELILPNRRKQFTVLISYDEQATSNTLSHVQTP